VNRQLRSVIGVAAAGVSLWLAFSGVDLRALESAFRAANPVWLAAAAVSVFVTITLVVLRLQLLASAWSDAPPFRLVWHLTIVGQVANIVVPFRLGDGVKIASATRSLGLPPVAAGAIVAVERLLDALALVSAALLLLALDAAPGWTRPVLASAAAAGLIAVAIGSVAAKWMARDHRTTSPSRRLPALPGFIARHVDLVRRGAAACSAPAVAVRLVAGSGAILLASAVTNLLTMRAFDLSVPAAAALLLLVLVQSGTALAAAPGGVGVSQFVAVETLGLWDVPPATALACSLAIFAIVRLPKIVMLPGALAAVSEARDAAAMKP
jgi:uncharacterized membrane protein YbhN (UPF0104 family)